MIQVEGVEYGTAAQVAARLGADVTAAMVRAWARRDGLRRVSRGRDVWYPLVEAATIEARKRCSGRGRARRVDNAALITA